MWREAGQQTSVCRGMRRRGRAQAGEKGCGVSEKIRACVNNHTFSVHCVWVRGGGGIDGKTGEPGDSTDGTRVQSCSVVTSHGEILVPSVLSQSIDL